MDRFVDEVGRGSIPPSRGRNPPVAEPGTLQADERAPGAGDIETAEPDSCVAGPRMPTTDMDHRGVLSDVEFPELFEAFDEIEQFVRRNPWPMLALGFAAGYWMSRSKAR